MVTTARRGRRSRRDGGAAAVEFALVVPILLLLVFGIIDYGIYFSDSLATRDGVRAAARQGVVQNFGTCQQLTCLAAVAKEQMDTLGGLKAVKIDVQNVGSNPPGWHRGNTLLICAQVATDGITHLTPLPDGGVITTKISMRIEQDDKAPFPLSFQDAPLTDDWDACT